MASRTGTKGIERGLHLRAAAERETGVACNECGLDVAVSAIAIARLFADGKEEASKKKRTRREKFLADMERVVPWSRVIAVIEPLCHTSGGVGRQPIGIPRMLRMYCLQQ